MSSLRRNKQEIPRERAEPTPADAAKRLCNLIIKVRDKNVRLVVDTPLGKTMDQLTEEVYEHRGVERRVLACGKTGCNAHCELDTIDNGKLVSVNVVPSSRDLSIYAAKKFRAPPKESLY